MRVENKNFTNVMVSSLYRFIILLLVGWMQSKILENGEG